MSSREGIFALNLTLNTILGSRPLVINKILYSSLNFLITILSTAKIGIKYPPGLNNNF